MARVVALVKLLPEEADTPLDKLVKEIKAALPHNTYEVLRSATEPVAFGIQALYLWIVMPENIEGGTYDLEERLSRVKGVSQVDVVRVSRLAE